MNIFSKRKNTEKVFLLVVLSCRGERSQNSGGSNSNETWKVEMITGTNVFSGYAFFRFTIINR